jgi:hypothetical protein
MADQTYVHSAARMLLESLGEQAPGYAVRRFRELSQSGDKFLADTWRDIYDTVLEMGREPTESDVIH